MSFRAVESTFEDADLTARNLLLGASFFFIFGKGDPHLIRLLLRKIHLLPLEKAFRGVEVVATYRTV